MIKYLGVAFPDNLHDHVVVDLDYLGNTVQLQRLLVSLAHLLVHTSVAPPDVPHGLADFCEPTAISEHVCQYLHRSMKVGGGGGGRLTGKVGLNR
eukprot:2601561-Rhodomonas_salina.2